MTPTPRSRRGALPPVAALLTTLFSALLASALSVVPAHGQDAFREYASTYLCSGYQGCADAGYSHYGYRQNGDEMYWLMYAGHNCTNYVAYRFVKQGWANERPWEGTGMAYNWGRANHRITDQTPMVGSVAWWNAGDGVGSSGHVAYVEKVVSARKIVISEDSWSGDFHWRTITKSGDSWPTGFVHFDDRAVRATTAPRITGTPAVGAPLTLDPGAWTPAAEREVQWYAGKEPIAGATGTSLTPTPAQLRTRISVRVTATARGYLPGKVTTERTTRVLRGTMTAAERPTITGTARVDEVLTVDPGGASPAADSREIRWYADGERIPGATDTRLRLGQDLIHQVITAEVVHRREAYKALVVTSAPTSPVAAGRFEITSPFTLSGGTRVGRTLTVAPGTYAPADADVTYTWLRDGVEIAGASGPAYVVTGADLGHRVTVRVDLRRTGYRDKSVSLATDRDVTTTPTITVDSSGGDHRAVVKLRLTAPGVESVTGRVTVRVAGREVVGKVVDGRLRVVVKDLEPGVRRVRVRYEGTALIDAARASDEVRVRRN